MYLAGDSSRFSQDGTGQWWYRFGQKNPCRIRVYAQSCPRCNREFVGAFTGGRSRAHSYCSKSCGIRAALEKDPRKFARERSPHWRGGTFLNRNGYVMQHAPDHWSVQGTTRKYVLQHRLVMEQLLGRPLSREEVVHHKNGIRTDNRPKNLELWSKAQPPGQRAAEQQHCPTCTCNQHRKVN